MVSNFKAFLLAGAIALPLAGTAALAETAQPSTVGGATAQATTPSVTAPTVQTPSVTAPTAPTAPAQPIEHVAEAVAQGLEHRGSNMAKTRKGQCATLADWPAPSRGAGRTASGEASET